MMKTIALVTQKGGSGKSTLCVNLAVAAQEAGASVCILEMDRQATISDWSEVRKSESPEVAFIEANQLEAVLARLADCDYDYVFIDTPGVDSPGALAAIRAADLCIVPSRPTLPDLRAVRPTLAAIYRLKKSFAFVLNQTPPRSYRVRDAAEGLIALGVLSEVQYRASQRPPGRAWRWAERDGVQPVGPGRRRDTPLMGLGGPAHRGGRGPPPAHPQREDGGQACQSSLSRA
jgi:chromosome partitioning protein